MRALPDPIIEQAPPRGRVLVLAPHPDDEVIGCGGALALHALQGDEVLVVVAFDGAASHPDLPREAVAARRQAESREAGRILSKGGRPIRYEFWNYQEGHTPSSKELARGADRIDQLVRNYQPQTTYSPWDRDDHQDHQTLARALRLGLVQHPMVAVRGFEVWTSLTPTILLDVTRVAERKRAALAAHSSQSAGGRLSHGALGLSAWRSLQVGGECGSAEAFTPFVRMTRRGAA